MSRQKVRTKIDGEWQLAILEDDGSITPVEERGIGSQAWRQVEDLGSGVVSLAGSVFGQPEWSEAAEQWTAERNAEFQDSDMLYPWQSAIGQGLPGLATAGITGGTTLAGQLATSTAIGAAESGLDLGEGGTMAQRAVAGAVGALLGEGSGRLAGRIWNTGKGLADDIRLGREQAEDVTARQAEDAGMTLLGSQRATPGTQHQRTLERLEQGAEASMFSPGLQEEALQANRRLFNQRTADAIGLDMGDYDNLGPDALAEAQRNMSEGFMRISDAAAEGGPIRISQEVADSIMNTRGQIKDLMGRGRFKGLEDGVLSGREWSVARRALMQDAANFAQNGKYEMADELFADVEYLDRVMEPRLTEEGLQEFARLREQYRVFRQVNKEGVVNPDGDVVIKTLNRKLRSQDGFGDAAKLGTGTVNSETQELIDVARLGSNPQFQPFRSSGTAENLNAQRVAGMALDPTQWVSLAGEMVAPVATGMTSRGGGRAVTGALSPAPVPLRAAGAAVGRSMLDEYLYPFVGAEDERYISQ